MEVQLYSFLTSARNAVDSPGLGSDNFTPGKGPRVPVETGARWAPEPVRSEEEEKYVSPLVGMEPLLLIRPARGLGTTLTKL